MAEFRQDDLVRSIKAESLRVHAPSTVVFLCGGEVGPKDRPPTKLRDALFRVAAITAPDYKIILAEDADPLTTEAGYNDLFSFESDIAQLVGLILLFVESPGSLAELGAFAALESVAPSLLAVLDDFYYSRSSFIRNGPIRYLENKYGEEWIHVLDRKEIGISDDGAIANLNHALFATRVASAVKDRLEARASWVKFDNQNSGHVIMLITGLCQEYGALTQSEIRSYLEVMGINCPRFSNYIYCTILLGWLVRVRKGNNIFYVATKGDAAIDYQLGGDSLTRDKVRWRADIRIYWQRSDNTRLRAIAGVMSQAGLTT